MGTDREKLEEILLDSESNFVRLVELNIMDMGSESGGIGVTLALNRDGTYFVEFTICNNGHLLWSKVLQCPFCGGFGRALTADDIQNLLHKHSKMK